MGSAPALSEGVGRVKTADGASLKGV